MSENEFGSEPDYFPDEQVEGVKVQAKLDHHTAMLGGVARIGRVVEAATDDPIAPQDIPRVLVQVGGTNKGSYVRNWMPWTTSRAGYDGEWWAPELEEQVLVIAPSGNLTQGIIVGSLYRGCLTFDSQAGEIIMRDSIPGDTSKKTETERQIHRRIYKDGSNISYDRNDHNLSMIIKSTPEAKENTSVAIVADKSIVLKAGTTQLTINQNGAVDIVTEGKNITISGNVKVKGTMDVSE